MTKYEKAKARIENREKVRQKRELEAIEAAKNAPTPEQEYLDISRKIRECEVEKDRYPIKKTNHILHLLLTILTGGVWLIVWILVAMNVSNSNSQAEAIKTRCIGELEELYLLKDRAELKIKGV